MVGGGGWANGRELKCPKDCIGLVQLCFREICVWIGIQVLGKWQGDWDLVGLGNRSLSFNVLCCKSLMYKLFILMNSLTNGMQHC